MPPGTFNFTLGHITDRKTRRRPAAASSLSFACWIAGLFSSVALSVSSSVIADVPCAAKKHRIAKADRDIALRCPRTPQRRVPTWVAAANRAFIGWIEVDRPLRGRSIELGELDPPMLNFRFIGW